MLDYFKKNFVSEEMLHCTFSQFCLKFPSHVCVVFGSVTTVHSAASDSLSPPLTISHNYVFFIQVKKFSAALALAVLHPRHRDVQLLPVNPYY